MVWGKMMEWDNQSYLDNQNLLLLLPLNLLKLLLNLKWNLLAETQ